MPKPSTVANVGTLTGTESIPLDNGTSTALKTTPADIKTYVGGLVLGTTAGTACEGNDSRLSDARTPVVSASYNWTAAQQGEVTALSVSANAIAISLAASNNFSVTLQATTGQTLSAPTDVVAGQSGVIAITQNATPSTLAYNAFWKFSGGVVPVVSTGANAVDIFTYYVIDSNKAICSLIKGVA